VKWNEVKSRSSGDQESQSQGQTACLFSCKSDISQQLIFVTV